MRGIPNLVRCPIDFKAWVTQLPSAEAVRPTHCPACGAPSRPVGLPLQLHGHGKRSRQDRGPAQPDTPPVTRLCLVRRYLCQVCGTGCTVGPSALLPRRLFSACAIALALALWGLEELPAPQVRRQVSPWTTVGAEAQLSWSSLRRWARAVRDGQLFDVRSCPASFSLRQVAARAATTLAACAQPAPLPLPHLAFQGALAP